MRDVIAALAVAALAVITMPACTWLFPMPDSRARSVMQRMEDTPVPATALPAEGEVDADWLSALLDAPPPYRTLGGVMVYQGKLAKVWPGRAAPLAASEQGLLDRFIAAAIAAPADDVKRLRPSDCLGSGDRSSPLVPRGLGDLHHQVSAGIACARMRFPGSAWLASTLQVHDRNATSRVLLRRPGGEIRVFDTDVTGFVALQHPGMP